MKQIFDLEWKKNMAFEAEINGHKLILDASPEVGGENKGPRPKTLMLAALAGCTGMDVVSLLKKMRIEITYFNVKIEANITEEHPKHYDNMHVIYQFGGNDLPMDKLENAVRLSQDKYCGVSATYKKGISVTWAIEIVK